MTGILKVIIALLHTQSETVNLGIEPTLARTKIKEVIEVAEECRMSIVAGEDIVNLRLKDRLKRIDAEIEEKKTVLEKKRETWPLKRLRLQVCRGLSPYPQKMTPTWRWQAGPISSFAV